MFLFFDLLFRQLNLKISARSLYSFKSTLTQCDFSLTKMFQGILPVNRVTFFFRKNVNKLSFFTLQLLYLLFDTDSRSLFRFCSTKSNDFFLPIFIYVPCFVFVYGSSNNRRYK